MCDSASSASCSWELLPAAVSTRTPAA
uniref:Uncharacterized protein n=1 Tax=Arundo donax TaxID=35708 RepID=A0A0A9F713_ARUDO